MRFNALMGLLSEPEGLRESFERQDGRKAPGVDGVRKDDYVVGLEQRPGDLSARLRRLGYQPQLKQLDERLRALRSQGGAAMLAYLIRHLRGHIQYYGVSGNSRALAGYLYQATRLLVKWLNRRSQKRSLNWERFRVVISSEVGPAGDSRRAV